MRAGAQEDDSIQQFAGSVLCWVVVANYSRERSCSIIGSFAIFIEPGTVEPTIQKSEVVHFVDQDYRDIRSYGETDYIRKYMNKGEPLFECVDAFTFSGVFDGITVGETSAQKGEAVAVSLIEAASEKTKSDPPEFGIGGPIDVVLLGEPQEAL